MFRKYCQNLSKILRIFGALQHKVFGASQSLIVIALEYKVFGAPKAMLSTAQKMEFFANFDFDVSKIFEYFEIFFNLSDVNFDQVTVKIYKFKKLRHSL